MRQLELGLTGPDQLELGLPEVGQTELGLENTFDYPFDSENYRLFFNRVVASGMYSWIGVVSRDGYDQWFHQTLLNPIHEDQDNSFIESAFKEFIDEEEKTYSDSWYEGHHLTILRPAVSRTDDEASEAEVKHESYEPIEEGSRWHGSPDGREQVWQMSLLLPVWFKRKFWNYATGTKSIK